jgi:hypothetical protein
MNRSFILKRDRVVISSLFLVILLILSCSITYSPAPKGPCPIDTLLIDKTLLPESTFYETGSRSADGAPARVGIERIGTSFASLDKGGVNHDVYRFNKDTEAFQEFKDVSKYYFINEANKPEWEQPKDLSNLKLHAYAYKIACSIITDVEPNVEVCQFVAQYGPYVTYLNVDMIALNYNDLSKLVSDIDRRMNLCLDKN